MRPGVNGTVTSCPRLLRRGFHRRAAAEHDQVGERDLLAALCAALKSLRIASSSANTFVEFGRLVGFDQSFCGSRRMRAPLAPPRRSVPRNVEAEAHAVFTSCGIDRPDVEHLLLQRGDVGVVDQRVVDRRNRVLPDQVFLRHELAEVAQPSGPCRGA